MALVEYLVAMWLRRGRYWKSGGAEIVFEFEVVAGVEVEV